MSTSASGASFRELLALAWPKLSAEQVELMSRHFELLTSWNKRLNLTRVTELSEAVRFHYGESLFLANVLPSGPLRIVDVGSGAGFPGLPISVARPESSVTLVESDQRKAVFLREAARGIQNVRILAQRAEQCLPEYDWIVSRAVLPAEVLATGIAPQAALLVSKADSVGSFSSIPIPWDGSRAVAMFHVEQVA